MKIVTEQDKVLWKDVKLTAKVAASLFNYCYTLEISSTAEQTCIGVNKELWSNPSQQLLTANNHIMVFMHFFLALFQHHLCFLLPVLKSRF